MGTPDFAVPALKALAQSGHDVAAVVAQPDRPKGRGRALQAPPVKLCAQSLGVPVLQPEKAGAPDFIQTLRDLKPDVVVVVAFGQILKKDLLDLPRLACVNLHSSLLPKYRGAAPINWAVINGEKKTGVSTMKMDEGLDTGDVLLTRVVPIHDSDDSQSLHDALAREGAELMLETLDRLEAGDLVPQPQDHERATYAPKLKKEDGLVQWDRPAETIRNLARGLEPWPGAYTFYKNKRLRLYRVEVAPGEAGDAPGTVVRVSDYGVEIGTAKDRIIATELQPEGKKRMTVKSFLQGRRILCGESLTSGPLPQLSNSI